MPASPALVCMKKFLILFIYFILALLIYVVALPYIFYMLTKPKYRTSLPARFFCVSRKNFTDGGIRIHACSFGETLSMKPFIQRFKSLGETVSVSVITTTGFDEATKIADETAHLPYEIFLPFCEPHSKLLIVTEAELWLMLFAVAKMKGAKTVLLNARISDRSYKSYKRFAFFYRALFGFVDLVLAQSELDRQRLAQLGAKNIVVTGNTKASLVHEVTKSYKKEVGKKTICAASTHEGEEELVFEAFASAFIKEQAKLIVVPRHPQRFDEVAQWLEGRCVEAGFSFARFSAKGDFDADVTLMDAMGELVNIYAISDVVVLGGAFARIGGHNPIEPASFGCKIITGPHIFNQKATFGEVSNYLVCEAGELENALRVSENLHASSILMDKDPLASAIKHIDELLLRK
jgi:3-deoxy-D-manno-octulosonic-acid transferase